MLKHIAVRLKSSHHGSIGFTIQKAQVVNSGLEKRDPALKNITEALHDLGLSYDVDGCSLHWFQIEDGRDIDYYLGLNEVEVAFGSDWYETQKARIRGFSGNRYYDACAELARSWDIKEQSRQVGYEIPRKAA